MFFLLYNTILFILNAEKVLLYKNIAAASANINYKNLVMMENKEWSDNYKKIIKRTNIFKNEKILDTINYINSTLYTDNITSRILYNTLAGYNKMVDLTENIPELLKYYTPSKELMFLINKKTKVYIHIEQLVARTNIYHIGISFRSIASNIRFDIVGIHINNFRFFSSDKKTKNLFWGYSSKTLNEIVEYESKLEYRYILGIYDCRHYVKNLTEWTTGKGTPIWSLDKLVD